ncbi:sulfatase-like hydrolase/transferase [Haloarcula marismortui]|uniref:sulfatase-like hydrolase/transferase n=1 Tax=Haloarcula marismortui TaxID=2238 RepID=UPI003C741271
MDDMNVVLVTVDCWRYDRCGFNGYSRDTTPVIDQIGEESLVYDNAIAPGAYTADSFPGILAGLESNSIAYYSELKWSAIPPEQDTLASRFKDLNYDTFASITNPQLSKNRGFSYGFDAFYNHRLERDQGSTSLEREQNPTGLFDYILDKAEEIWSQLGTEKGILSQFPYIIYRYHQSRERWPTVPAETVMSDFIDKIGSYSDSERPFFGWTHLMDLHAPINPNTTTATPVEQEFSKARALYWDSERVTQQPSSGYDYLYDCALRYIDEQIGRLVDELQAMGLWENTILLITGDHGETLYDRGVYDHPFHYAFDDLLKVPLVVRSPDVDPRRIQSNFSLCWISELISALLQESSLALTQNCEPSLHLNDEAPKSIIVSDMVTEKGYTITIRNSEIKYIKHFGGNPYSSDPLHDLLKPYNEGVLYNIREDRHEQHQLEVNNAPQEFKQRAEDSYESVQELSFIEGEIDSGTKQKLKDLGYV